MPNLAKEYAAFLMNSIDNWLPCINMFFCPNARRIGIAVNDVNFVTHPRDETEMFQFRGHWQKRAYRQ